MNKLHINTKWFYSDKHEAVNVNVSVKQVMILLPSVPVVCFSVYVKSQHTAGERMALQSYVVKERIQILSRCVSILQFYNDQVLPKVRVM